MKRRDFVKNTGLLIGTTLLSGYQTTSFAKTKKLKVLILGAGFAGLSAAYLLTQAGFEVTLLEARNRIGGRVFSHKIYEKDNLTVELGAEWVGASHERILALCKQFGLSLQEHRFSEQTYLQDKLSTSLYTEEWTKKYTPLLEKYRNMPEKDKKELDKLDWWRYLVNNGINERDLYIKELLDSTDFGESIRVVSADMAIAEYAESSPANEMDFKIVGGNSMLAQSFAQRIGTEKILLNHEVTKVNQQSHKVVVTCRNGTTFAADKAICCLPTFALSKILWEPGLPIAKMEAINALQYARIYKNSLLYSERFWKQENTAVISDLIGQYYFHSTQNQISNYGAMTSYSIGDKAMALSSMTETRRTNTLSNDLEEVFGVKTPLKGYAGYYWGNDAYSQGAYAIYGKNQWYTLRPALQKPFMNVSFAGEHLADWQGFMEGAINSGEEAAHQLIK